MKQYGLIGFPLSHSFSKKYFEKKFSTLGLKDHSFINFELRELDELNDLVTNHPHLLGLSITIPYKERVLSFLDETDPLVIEIGAANAIKIIRSKKQILLKGYNTDALGFEGSILPLLKSNHYKALILGSGGASKAIAYALRKMGIEYKIISRRNGDLLYKQLDKKILLEHQLIVNTTPLGMFPGIDECPPIPYTNISKDHIAYDLTYNPEKSLFLKNSEDQGAMIINGLSMLKNQADRTWDIWNK
ncbi:MAG: shikimate dehydrogenase [Bacteroidetes bacterium]|nr:shikimate dehydrogenase [Bacteroidota bacterium]MBL6962696.1 shikimate dehydrogenase [Bacteroidota bacterium]